MRKRKQRAGREGVVGAVAAVISRLEAEQAAFHYGELSGENISSTMKECVGFCCVRNESFKGGCAAHRASFCLLPVDYKVNLWNLAPLDQILSSNPKRGKVYDQQTVKNMCLSILLSLNLPSHTTGRNKGSRLRKIVMEVRKR